jgi:hypothetical protein
MMAPKVRVPPVYLLGEKVGELFALFGATVRTNVQQLQICDTIDLDRGDSTSFQKMSWMNVILVLNSDRPSTLVHKIEHKRFVESVQVLPLNLGLEESKRVLFVHFKQFQRRKGLAPMPFHYLQDFSRSYR